MHIDLPLKVAVIEDDKFQNQVMTSMVNKVEGLVAVPLQNPLEALHEIEKNKIRVVLTDIVLPDMYGDDLIKKCRSFDWFIDFIVTTGMEKMLVSYRCFNLGAREVFIKPIDEKLMHESLNLILRRYKRWNDTVKHIVEKKQKPSES